MYCILLLIFTSHPYSILVLMWKLAQIFISEGLNPFVWITLLSRYDAMGTQPLKLCPFVTATLVRLCWTLPAGMTLNKDDLECQLASSLWSIVEFHLCMIMIWGCLRNVEGLVHPQRNILPFMSFQTCMTKSGPHELYSTLKKCFVRDNGIADS